MDSRNDVCRWLWNGDYFSIILRNSLTVVILQTLSLLSTFFLAMLLHPNIYKRVQEEPDSAVGRDRIPCHSDRSRLPYVEAVLEETLRWKRIGPMGNGC